MDLKPKISIIGCGNVGVRYAYALMISGIARHIVMVDIDKRRVEGEVMDLSHGIPYLPTVTIEAGDFPDIADSDLVVITAGKSQKPEQTRLDLVRGNIELFRELIPRIERHAPYSIYLIVTNPVDVLSYAAYKFSGKPPGEIFGSGTALDTARLRFELAQHCRIHPRNIHAYILGEHGDSEFAFWSKAMVGGLLLKDYCKICENSELCNPAEELNVIFQKVRDSAYEIIERKKETSYGIGLTLVQLTKAVVNNENAIMPVSTYVENYCSVEDIYIGLPAVINKNGIKSVLNLELNEMERDLFQKSAAIIKQFTNELTS